MGGRRERQLGAGKLAGNNGFDRNLCDQPVGLLHQVAKACGAGGVDIGELWGIAFQQGADVIGAVVPQTGMLDKQPFVTLPKEVGRAALAATMHSSTRRWASF